MDLGELRSGTMGVRLALGNLWNYIIYQVPSQTIENLNPWSNEEWPNRGKGKGCRESNSEINAIKQTRNVKLSGKIHKCERNDKTNTLNECKKRLLDAREDQSTFQNLFGLFQQNHREKNTLEKSTLL